MRSRHRRREPDRWGRREGASFELTDDEHPLAAFGLSLAAGVLMFIEGWYLSLVASVADAAGLLGAGDLLSGLGFLGLLFGLIVVVLAVLLYRNPGANVGYGIAILVFSLLSLFSGGGFILGAILGVIGGILAMLYEESDSEELLPGEVLSRAGGDYWSACVNCGATIPPRAFACPRCGVRAPTVGSGAAAVNAS